MRKIIFYFVFGTIFGWILEVSFKIITNQTSYTSGMASGPFCILYGFGAVILAEIIAKFTNRKKYIFILSAISLTILELITGIILDKIYGIELWNYLDQKFCINKYICWEFVLLWGIVGVVFIKFFLPKLNRFFTKNDSVLLRIVEYNLIIFIALDYTISSIKILSLKG